MNKIEQKFLEALCASMKEEKVSWEGELSSEEWTALITYAEKHQVLNMIYAAAYQCPDIQRMQPELLAAVKRQVVHSVMLQSGRTEEFLTLYRYLKDQGMAPWVVKGIICRNLYPDPDQRISGDEDLWIAPEEFEKLHEMLLAWGMQLTDPQQDIHGSFEVSYSKKGSPIYLEVHKALFSPEEEAYAELNGFFEHVPERKKEVTIAETEISTMDSTDHLFYLICHAMKHFLHSGFGIRQVCDIVMFAMNYGEEIDWEKIYGMCRRIRAEQFTAAIFKIGEKYLAFDASKAYYPSWWKELPIDEAKLLEDLLDAGVYGDASMNRKHSSNITLHAVTAQRSGKNASLSVWKTAFPSRKRLEGRYGYLKKHPYLLPLAWIQRFLKYYQESKNMEENQASDAISIGNQRVELLKYYHILE